VVSQVHFFFAFMLFIVLADVWQYVRLCIGHALNCNIPDVSRRGAATHHVRAAAGSPLATDDHGARFGFVVFFHVKHRQPPPFPLQ